MGHKYRLTGTVKQGPCDQDSLGAVILPRDNRTYLEFGFLSPKDDGGVYNGVFYIPLAESQAAAIASVIVEALVKKIPVIIDYTRDQVWDPNESPGGLVIKAELMSSPDSV
jgi:hypothetical protein